MAREAVKRVLTPYRGLKDASEAAEARPSAIAVEESKLIGALDAGSRATSTVDQVQRIQGARWMTAERAKTIHRQPYEMRARGPQEDGFCSDCKAK